MRLNLTTKITAVSGEIIQIETRDNRGIIIPEKDAEEKVVQVKNEKGELVDKALLRDATGLDLIKVYVDTIFRVTPRICTDDDAKDTNLLWGYIRRAQNREKGSVVIDALLAKWLKELSSRQLIQSEDEIKKGGKPITYASAIWGANAYWILEQIGIFEPQPIDKELEAQFKEE